MRVLQGAPRSAGLRHGQSRSRSLKQTSSLSEQASHLRLRSEEEGSKLLYYAPPFKKSPVCQDRALPVHGCVIWPALGGLTGSLRTEAEPKVVT